MTDAIGASAFAALDTPEGVALLAALAGFDEEHAAAAVQRARALASPTIAKAALATAFARRRAAAAGKFDHPEAMLLTRAGYEQATSSAVARHRAERFRGCGSVADLCCGIGGDAVAIAASAGRVFGVDLDPDALACARANARAAGAGDRTRFELADATEVSLAGVDAAFADPSRRSGGGRIRAAAAYSPPLHALLRRARELPAGRMCVKSAPGTDPADATLAAALGELALEAEFVSERGTCKEAVFWCGALARSDGARRATVIDGVGAHVLDGDPSAVAATSRLLACVGEVDAAVIRAGLIGALCGARDWAVLDRRVAYVTAEKPRIDPFARWYRVADALPFNVKHVRNYLRARGIGEVVVKTRAFPLTPDQIVALLKPRGDDRATIVCTTIGRQKTAIVCEPL